MRVMRPERTAFWPISWTFVFLGFGGLPFLFNSCQESGSAKKSSGSEVTVGFEEVDLSEKYCSSTFGSSNKLVRQMSPFAKQKVYVNFKNTDSSQKFSQRPTDLLVVINNACLASSEPSSFARSVAGNQKVFPILKT